MTQAAVSVGKIAFIDSNDDLWVFGGESTSVMPDHNEMFLTPILPDIKFSYVDVTIMVITAIDTYGNIWYSGQFSPSDQFHGFTQLTDIVTFTHLSLHMGVECSCLAIDINNNLYGYGGFYGRGELVFLKDNIKMVFNRGYTIMCIDVSDELWIRFNGEEGVFHKITQGSWVKGATNCWSDILILSKSGELLLTARKGISDAIASHNIL